MKLLREPLVHFLLLGLGLVLLFRWVGADDQLAPDRIVVSAPRIEQLRAIFRKTWQRPPTEEELQGMIDSFVREEIYYREALAMGLDRDDTIVRRRMTQKLEFVTDDLIAGFDPTDEELRSYHEENADAFRRPARFTFRQLYFNRDRRGASAADDAAAAVERLNAGAEADSDALLLPESHELLSEDQATRLFGAAFGEALIDLPVGSWAGPVESGFGLHVVRVSQREDRVLPPVEEVRALVEREWRAERRGEAAEAFYDGLRQRYDIVIETEPAT